MQIDCVKQTLIVYLEFFMVAEHLAETRLL